MQSLSARKFVANCRFVRLLFSPSQEKFDAVREGSSLEEVRKNRRKEC